MNIGSQRILAWSGPLAIVVFFIGFWPMAHFIPPLSPSLSAAEVAAFFRANSGGIRGNGITILLSASLLAAFYGEISVQLKRIEGPFSPMTYAQLLTGVLAVVSFIPAAVAWCVAAYRPERSDDIIYMLSDFGWLLLFMVGAPALIQALIVGIAVLNDARPDPILPRWFGYFCFGCGIMGDIPGWAVVFFKSGPFAWNGLFCFWIPATAFGIWTLGTFVVMLKAIRQQELAG